MPASIQQIVSDPDFARLSADDQAAVVAHFDSDFTQVPDGEKATVIQHLQKQALSRPDLAPPPGAARPQVNMQPWGGNPSPTAGLPGSSPNPVAATPGYTAAVGLPLAGAAAVMAPGAATAGGLLWRGAKGAIQAAPYIAASEAINYARQAVPGGKYIPRGAELLPLFMAGGKGKAAEGEAAAAPKDAGDPFRNVPDPEADVFRERAPRPVPPTREAAAQAAVEEFSARSGVGVQNAPYTYSGESALRQVLTGLGNKELLQIARSRGIDVAKEAALKPGLADTRLVSKIIDDFAPEELDEFGNQYLEATRMGRPSGVGAEAYKTTVLQQFFPGLKIPQAQLQRTQKAFANRPRASTLLDMLPQSAGQQ